MSLQNLGSSITTGNVDVGGNGSSATIGLQNLDLGILGTAAVATTLGHIWGLQDLGSTITTGNLGVGGNGSSIKVGLQNLGKVDGVKVIGDGNKVIENHLQDLGMSAVSYGPNGEKLVATMGPGGSMHASMGGLQNLGSTITTGNLGVGGNGSSIKVGLQNLKSLSQYPAHPNSCSRWGWCSQNLQDLGSTITTGNLGVGGNGSSIKVGLQNLRKAGGVQVIGDGNRVIENHLQDLGMSAVSYGPNGEKLVATMGPGGQMHASMGGLQNLDSTVTTGNIDVSGNGSTATVGLLLI